MIRWFSFVLLWVALFGGTAVAADRPLLAVLDFDGSQAKFSHAEVAELTKIVAKEAFEKLSGKFVIIGRANLIALLEGHGKALEGCQEECGVEVGRLIGVDVVVSGAILQGFGEYSVEVTAHSTHPPKAIAIQNSTVKRKRQLPGLISKLAKQLMWDVGRTLPAKSTGSVTAKSTTSIAPPSAPSTLAPSTPAPVTPAPVTPASPRMTNSGQDSESSERYATDGNWAATLAWVGGGATVLAVGIKFLGDSATKGHEARMVVFEDAALVGVTGASAQEYDALLAEASNYEIIGLGGVFLGTSALGYGLIRIFTTLNVADTANWRVEPSLTQDSGSISVSGRF
jgi:hypothetical protein